jgi:DNA polymerase I-like protein with 3'-5' exonuclease and polymerase domains
MIAINSAKQAACRYLELGLAPIPVPWRSKNPTVPNWPSLRIGHDSLDAHFPDGEQSNIGVLNGEPSGNVLDADLDCPEARLAAPFILPDTGCIFGRKSAPQSHRIYRTETALDAAQHKYKDLDGAVLVEARGTGGHTVFPPSSHAESGEAVIWDRFEKPGQVLLSDLQKSIAELAACSLFARHWPAKGSRQDAYLALIGGFLRAGWARDRVERFVTALAAATGDDEARKRAAIVAQTAGKQQADKKTTGWPRLAELLGQDGKAVVSRALGWLGITSKKADSQSSTTKKPRELPPYRPFPVDALPSPVREYVEQGALALGCDPAFIALPVLAAVAGLIGFTRVVRPKRTWRVSSVLWTLVIADSGSLKTPAFRLATDHLFTMQRRLDQEYKRELAEFVEASERWKAAAKDFKDGEGEDPGDKPEPPASRTLFTSDATIEAIAELIGDNPRGLLVACDELAGWLGSFARYKGQAGGTDLPRWLSMHSAGGFAYHRKTGDKRRIVVPNAAVSIAGGIQPGIVARVMAGEFLEAGLAGRLLMAMPPRSIKVWSDQEIDPEVEQRYQTLLESLYALESDNRQREDVPHVLKLSPDAFAAWTRWYNAWGRQQHAVEGAQAAAYAKLEEATGRLGLIHHVVTKVGRSESDLCEIEVESIDAGEAIARWFAAESTRVYALLGESEEQRDARRLIEFIRSKAGTITVRQLQRSNNSKYPSTEAAENALEALVKNGLGDWQVRPASRKGGRLPQFFTLRPTADKTDETPDEWDPMSEDEAESQTDTTTDKTLSDAGISNVSEGFVGFVSGQAEYSAPNPEHQCGETSPGDSVSGDEVLSVATPGTSRYLLVSNQTGLQAVHTALDGGQFVALDIETTGLDARRDRVRLLSLGVETVDGSTFAYLIDCFQIDPTCLWERLAEKTLVIHNAAFDLAFLDRLGFVSGKVVDTMLQAQMLVAGTNERCSLAACCSRYLGQALDKQEQKSDWAGTLTTSQLDYAAADVEVLGPLADALQAEMRKTGISSAAEIEARCLPTLVWMGSNGVAIDKDAWQANADQASAEANRVRELLDQQSPLRPGDLYSSSWNWDSPAQVREALALVGCQIESTGDDELAKIDHPIANLLRKYRLARKRVTTYGPEWLKNIREDGRIYPGWRQLGASSGRMSCSEPNMQQLPRGEYRRCVLAPPRRMLVKADYSQIELRIAAKVSGDAALLEAYRSGEDLHTRTARVVLGIREVTKLDRQLAKALNFGLLYGMGAKGFRSYAKSQYGLDLTEDEANRYKHAFFKTYPGLASWHRRIRTWKTNETRTLTGRRLLLNDRTPDTIRMNAPVQGTGADGLKLALALLWERRGEQPESFPVLAVHDEIVVECDAGRTKGVAAWLKKAMLDGMAGLIDPVPVEVEVKTGKTWEG